MSNISLGDGVFSVGANATSLTAVALTRGGGSFVVEKENRLIEADGDYGPVQGRIRPIRAVPTMTLNALEQLESNMTNFYPGLSTSSAGNGNTFTQLLSYTSSLDYKCVAFTGQTLGGRQIYIQLDNAINLGNIDWPLVDKDEIVPEIVFTATYLSTARTTVPFKVVYGTTS